MPWTAGVYRKGNYSTNGWTGDAANSIGIEAGRHDTQDDDFANGINNCLAKDGTNQMTADLNFGGSAKPINVAAGTAAAPAYCAGGDVDTGIFSPAANQLAISTGGVERVRFDSNGRLGIGTTTPSEPLDVNGNQRFSASGTSTVHAFVSSGTNVTLNLVAGASTFGSNGAGISIKSTGASDDGEILFNTNQGGVGSNTRLKIDNAGAKWFSNGYHYYEASGITSGAGTNALKYHTSTGLVTWDASSQLVKQNIVNCPHGLAAVMQLKPRKYYRTDDQSDEIGFVADELIQVLPEMVSLAPKSRFTKNELDTEMVPSSVAYEKLTAILCKAIQELSAKVEALEATTSVA